MQASSNFPKRWPNRGRCSSLPLKSRPRSCAWNESLRTAIGRCYWPRSLETPMSFTCTLDDKYPALGTARELAGFLAGTILKTEGRSRMRKLGILIGGALALAACAQNPPPRPVDLNNPLLAPGFLAQAGSANEFEIESSQLALQASQNPAVRNFANVLITDHTQLGQQVGAAAGSARLQPPPAILLPPQQAMLDQL